MALTDELSDVLMEFNCPDCSHPFARFGSWLRTIGTFRCVGCNAMVRIGYEHKLSIFARYLTTRQKPRSGRAQERRLHRLIPAARRSCQTLARLSPGSATAPSRQGRAITSTPVRTAVRWLTSGTCVRFSGTKSRAISRWTLKTARQSLCSRVSENNNDLVRTGMNMSVTTHKYHGQEKRAPNLSRTWRGDYRVRRNEVRSPPPFMFRAANVFPSRILLRAKANSNQCR